MSSSVDRLSRRLVRQERGIFAAQTAPRLPYSSIDSGALELRDPEGNVAGFVGQQFDGTVTSASVGGTWPSIPSGPLVTPIVGGLRLYWDGTYEDGSLTRMDFKRITFHATTDPTLSDLDILSPSQIVGEVTIATGGEVTVSLPIVEQYVVCVAWTDAGKFSEPSVPGFGTPIAPVDQATVAQIETDVAAANAAVADSPVVFRQGTEPVVEAGKKAIWFDTANGNITTYFDGTSWAPLPLGQQALAADAVVASTIAVGALDGKTITGPLIQTVATTARGIKLVGDSLVTYDAAGAATFALNGSDGSISMVGALLTGGSITGPMLQTSSSTDRGIKIVGNYLRAYNGTGVATVVINGNNGSMTLTGPSISSAEITGSTFRTATTGQRVEINSSANVNQIGFYMGHASEVKPGLIVSRFDSGTGESRTEFSGPSITNQYDYASLILGQTATGETSATISAERASIVGSAAVSVSRSLTSLAMDPNASINEASRGVPFRLGSYGNGVGVSWGSGVWSGIYDIAGVEIQAGSGTTSWRHQFTDAGLKIYRTDLDGGSQSSPGIDINSTRVRITGPKFEVKGTMKQDTDGDFAFGTAAVAVYSGFATDWDSGSHITRRGNHADLIMNFSATAASAAGTTLMTLGATYRPTRTIRTGVWNVSTGTPTYMLITPAGAVACGMNLAVGHIVVGSSPLPLALPA